MVDGERAVELQRLVASRSVKPRTRSATEMRRGALRVRNHVLAWGARTYVMGIVKVSPDSFSADGADMIDVGAESTRPGHRPISGDLERARLLPALAAIRAGAPDAIVSVDTFKAGVFRAAHAAGGDILNSIWGARDDVIEACVDTGAPLVVMHNKPVPVYERDVVDEVLAYLDDAASRCVRAGIPPEHVILDPGIGFGKLPEHNLVVLGALGRLVALGFPTLIGTSRKSTIGKLTGRAEHYQIVFRQLAEADAGIEDDVFGRDPGTYAARGGVVEVREHFVDDVALVDGHRFVVHDDERCAGVDAGLDHVVARAPDRVEDVAAGCVRGAKDAGFEGVDRDDRVGGSGSDRGQRGEQAGAFEVA